MSVFMFLFSVWVFSMFLDGESRKSKARGQFNEEVREASKSQEEMQTADDIQRAVDKEGFRK